MLALSPITISRNLKVVHHVTALHRPTQKTFLIRLDDSTREGIENQFREEGDPFTLTPISAKWPQGIPYITRPRVSVERLRSKEFRLFQTLELAEVQ